METRIIVMSELISNITDVLCNSSVKDNDFIVM